MLMMPYAILAMPEGSGRDFMEILYRSHCRLMYATAWKYTTSPEKADDIVSDSCLALIRNIDTLRTLSERPLRAYIAKTVRHTALNLLARDARTDRRFAHPEEDEYRDLPGQIDIEQKILLQDELDRVWKAVSSLPEKEQLVMQLKYEANLTHEEIAEQTGLSASSVDTYIRRARVKIRAMVYGADE